MLNRAIIFGGTRGVGYEIASMLSKKGNTELIFTGRNIENVMEVEKNFNNNVLGMELDMSDTVSVENFKTKVDKIKFKPNVLIFNAGYLSLKSEEKDRNIEKLFKVNTTTPIILTQHFLKSMKKENYGHIIFNSPEYKIDEKIKLLTPYMQSKLAQTTYMKSLSYILKKNNISCNSIWTKYPLWTDAIRMRNIGDINSCVSPQILADVVDQIIYHENPKYFKGNNILDSEYLKDKKINIEKYYLGSETESLDELFYHHLNKRLETKKYQYNF